MRRLFHALLHEAGLRGEKREFLRERGFWSTLELSVADLDAVIRQLRQLISQPQSGVSRADDLLVLKQKRSHILKVATEVGIKDPNDWLSFNRWMLNYSVYRKELHRHSYSELEKVLKQLLSIQGKPQAYNWQGYLKEARQQGLLSQN